MPYGHRQSGRSLHLISGISLAEIGSEEYDHPLRLGIVFLLNALGEPPLGSELAIETIDDEHRHERMIVLSFDRSEEEPEGAEMYALRAQKAVELFFAAVNWQAIGKSAVEAYLAGQTLYPEEDLLNLPLEE
jgi:hypothetical protein